MSDSWKYVSVVSTVGTLIFSLVALCVIFVPFSFGAGAETVFTYSKLGVIGDGSVAAYLEETVNYILQIAPNLNDRTAGVLTATVKAAFYGYFIILLSDVVFSVTLIICRNRIVRKVFEIISIFFAVLMIVITLVFLAYIGLRVYEIIAGNLAFYDVLYTHGVTTLGAMLIISFILIFKQFKWFKKPY